VRLRFTVRSSGAGLPGALVTVTGHRLRTDLSGHATVVLAPEHAGVIDAFARYPGSAPTVVVLIVS
jgi:hypothetical protein